MNLDRFFKIFAIFIFTNFTGYLSASQRSFIIESFEEQNINFSSFEDEDIEPDSYEISSENTANPYSYYSLKIWGNTWKVENLDPITLSENSVWQIDVFCYNEPDIQGFGLSDGDNTLFYSFFGTEELDIEQWVPVYQGSQPQDNWYSFQLPVADDWFAWYEELPTITEIIFVNDADDNSGIVYYDNVLDITDDLPIPPEVEVSFSIIRNFRDRNGLRNVTIQFYSDVIDPDSDEHSFIWHFGDGNSSDLSEPEHTYLVEDDHSYTVLLEVIDDTEKSGFGSCEVTVDPGNTSFPLTMNFVGDVMLARNMQQVIYNQGMQSIIDPTYPFLGGAADITAINLECPFTNAYTSHPTKSIVFKAEPDHISALDHMGTDVVTLANNHIWDYMNDGLLDTTNYLDSLGIPYSGAGMNSCEAYQPAFVNRSGVNIAFLFSSDRTGQYNNCQPYLQAGFDKPGFAYMTPYYVSQQIDSVQDVADLIVVNTHSGSEYSTAPGANYDFAQLFPGWDEKDFNEEEDFSPRADIPHMWDIDIRHHFIDSGADIVICHHPHVIQGLEIYNGKLIAHSLGNFIFDLSYAETFPSMILNTKIDENGFDEYSITPVFIDNYIPRRAEGDLGKNILEYLAMRSRELNTYLKIDRQNITAEVIIDTLLMNSQILEFSESAILTDQDTCFISQPVKLAGNGYFSKLNSIQPAGSFDVRFGNELIWNGNYEDEGSTEWNVNSDYEWYDEDEYFSGERSLCLFRDSSMGIHVITDLEHRIKRPTGSQVSLHGYIKTDNAAEAKMEFHSFANRNGGDPITTENIGNLFGTNDWQYFSVNINMEDEANFLNINSSLAPPDNGDAYAWFDEVGIIEWTAWQNFNPNMEIWNPNNYRYLQIKTDYEIASVQVFGEETNYSNPLVQNNENQIPDLKTAKLHQNYPNPFNPSTTISFSLNTEISENTELNIYNLRGQKVKSFRNHAEFIETFGNPNTYSVTWNGTNNNNKHVSSGIYFYQLKVDGVAIAARKCLLLK
ncbi:MAG: CapA family protein [Candidatus Cloacimonetes bacterium]|nr:CapA family protein [Candidatus Cloacimonadota bacterium]MCF7812926.1 CapA family protein [Candidatus Cloacimonadota bacterium]MCF7867138.1 CapA family protein [Candidatus Cloacimonadota bacterium]MCF7882542.1 CapA family protein [Candidatus Cloacimonadota bacterium]